ncbi:MAG: N-acetylmuramoyl-L-alanine amidase [Oscillospiraceae bacterium]|nr:N-acetylmuramoyl-L-alanine amidase [Oscillospiraceae bacterium]
MNLISHYLTKNPCYQANLNRADSRYTNFQAAGPKGLMLHSVGCAQPSAEVFCRLWDREDYNGACVHAFIDAKTGAVWQTLPWNYRGWHCGGSGNDTHLGVELCESSAIRYESGVKFTVLDRAAALADCSRAYQAAVELFATLCAQYKLDPKQAICSHKEGCSRGIATAHGDPEHYWAGLGTSYSMAGFRADVAKTLQKSQSTAEAAPAPAGSAAFPFPETSPDAWYADALRWALERHILSAGDSFRPEAPCSMASAVVLLRRLWMDLQR